MHNNYPSVAISGTLSGAQGMSKPVEVTGTPSISHNLSLLAERMNSLNDIESALDGILTFLSGENQATNVPQPSMPNTPPPQDVNGQLANLNHYCTRKVGGISLILAEINRALGR